MPQMNVDMFVPFVPKEAKESVAETLNTRWIGQGPKCEQFEKDFRRKFGVKHAVSVNSGTAALETAYDILELKAGDEVISTPLTCTATNMPLLARGVKIVWADILESTLCIDPADVRRKVTEKTRAIVQVHLGGIKADVGEVMGFDHDQMPKRIPVVSDAAQALGIFNGDFTCCSFQAIKHMTTADGGMLICNQDEQAYKSKLLRWFGIDREIKTVNDFKAYRKRKMTFDVEVIGYKRQMNDIAAAMGIEGLKYYDRIMQHHWLLFETYRRKLNAFSGIKLLDGAENKYWLITVLVDRLEDFAKLMFEADIDISTVQHRNDRYSIFKKLCAPQELPVMDKLEFQYVCLPINMHVTVDQVEMICDVIRKGW